MRAAVRLEKNPNWRGGHYLENGYIMAKAETHPRANKWGYVFEHILVLEKKLGRLLATNEISHHKDGNRQNNNPNNLQAMTRAEHAVIHGDVGQRQAAKTHCPFGHPYDDVNTYVNPKGSRVCRICKRLRGQKH